MNSRLCCAVHTDSSISMLHLLKLACTHRRVMKTSRAKLKLVKPAITCWLEIEASTLKVTGHGCVVSAERGPGMGKCRPPTVKKCRPGAGTVLGGCGSPNLKAVAPNIQYIAFNTQCLRKQKHRFILTNAYKSIFYSRGGETFVSWRPLFKSLGIS